MNKLKTLMAATASVLAFASAAQAMDDVVIAFAGTEDPVRDAEYVFIEAFANSLAEHGVQSVIHPANSLGKESERFDQVSQGLINVNVANGGTLFKASEFRTSCSCHSCSAAKRSLTRRWKIRAHMIT
ncbi:MAG: hypothetical protein R3D81_13935 [Thalassovita sp.]